MRRLLVLAMLAGGLFAAVDGADARTYKTYKKYRYYKVYNNSDSAIAIRARSVDPAGDYKAYPYWARYALSPKGGDRWN